VIRLRYDDQSAAISPTGAALSSYAVDGVMVAGSAEPTPGALYNGAVLAPWPNRVRDGKWRWRGVEHQLPINETDRQCALHGFVAHRDWAVAAQAADSLTLQTSLRDEPGYPFALDLSVEYELRADGFASRITAVNVSETAAPVGLGMHSYLAATAGVDGASLLLPAERVVCVDERGLPIATRPVAGDTDLRAGAPVGRRVLDHAFTGLDRDARGRVTAAVVVGGQEIRVWGGSTCRFVQVYTGDTLPQPWFRRLLAVEPTTSGPNALAQVDDDSAAMDLVEPGASLTLEWGIQSGRRD
jgi:aldose 1-epimerase